MRKMGKNGERLRAAKAERVTYTFTKKQLEDHDRQVVRAWREQAFQRMKKEADSLAKAREQELMKRVNEEWDNRAAEFNTDDAAENFQALLQYMLSIPARVLIEQFGWQPVTGHRFSKNNKIVRFCTGVAEEMAKIRSDDLMDIRKYSDETFKLYGVKFTREEEE